ELFHFPGTEPHFSGYWDDYRRLGQRNWRGGTGTGTGPTGHGRSASGTRSFAHAGAWLHTSGRYARTTGNCHFDVWLLAAEVRRRSRDPGQNVNDRRQTAPG